MVMHATTAMHDNEYPLPPPPVPVGLGVAHHGPGRALRGLYAGGRGAQRRAAGDAEREGEGGGA